MHIDVTSKKLSKAEKVAICEFHANLFGRRMCNIAKLTMDRLDKIIADEKIDIRAVVREMNRHIEEQRVIENKKRMQMEQLRRETDDANRKRIQKLNEKRDEQLQVWKALKPSQREFIAKSIYAKNLASIEIRQQKDRRLAEALISDHNKKIDGVKYPEKLLDVEKDVILDLQGYSIPKLRVEVCNIGWNALPKTFVEDTLKTDTPPANVFIPEMLHQFQRANLITAHIRVAPNGRKFIPMKRITRHYINR